MDIMFVKFFHVVDLHARHRMLAILRVFVFMPVVLEIMLRESLRMFERRLAPRAGGDTETDEQAGNPGCGARFFYHEARGGIPSALSRCGYFFADHSPAASGALLSRRTRAELLSSCKRHAY